MVVDDHAHIRISIKEYFSDIYKIVEASDGREALNYALEIVPDLIICDVVMPRMDGIELCKKIKNNISTSHIPVILLTAKSAKEYRIKGYETGADDYIEKPVDLSVLKARSENLVNSRNKLNWLQPDQPTGGKRYYWSVIGSISVFIRNVRANEFNTFPKYLLRRSTLDISRRQAKPQPRYARLP